MSAAEDELTPALEMAVDDALVLLGCGELTVEGRLIDASNATLYCSVAADGVVAACVYKPVSGERPLWDFPDGTLAEREVAAYEVSAATGWLIVPPTLYRDGRAARPGHGAALDRHGRERRPGRPAAQPLVRGAAADRHVRRRDQQRRSQRRPPAADRRRAPVRRRPRHQLPRRVRSCARCCGNGPATGSPTRRPTACSICGANSMARSVSGCTSF